MTRIRPAQPDEWLALKALRLEALQDTPDAFGDTYAQALAFDDAHWQTMVSAQRCFVAVNDGQLVGMVYGMPHHQRGGHWMFGLFVQPAHRGSGIADALVEAVADQARRDGGVALNLYVAKSLVGAHAFYRRLGFTPSGVTKPMDRDPSIVLDHLRLPLGDLVITTVPAYRLHDLRRRVLRGNDPNADAGDARDDDADALHLAGLINGVVVVSASFYPSPAPVNPELLTYQLRYMATEFDLQGLGYGAQVLAHGEGLLKERGAQQLWANGRDTALRFYVANGWELIAGSEHLSPYTNLPHTVIFKRL